MSCRPGASDQPLWVTFRRTSSDAPQAGQLSVVPPLTVPHQLQVYWRAGAGAD